MFTYAHVKWFYGQSERAYYLNYFMTLYIILASKYGMLFLFLDTNTKKKLLLLLLFVITDGKIALKVRDTIFFSAR